MTRGSSFGRASDRWCCVLKTSRLPSCFPDFFIHHLPGLLFQSATFVWAIIWTWVDGNHMGLWVPGPQPLHMNSTYPFDCRSGWYLRTDWVAPGLVTGRLIIPNVQADFDFAFDDHDNLLERNEYLSERWSHQDLPLTGLLIWSGRHKKGDHIIFKKNDHERWT